jgi:ubiquitin-activating enzyme E1
LHLDFIVAAANLHAFNYGLRGERNIDLFKKVVDAIEIPPFVPKSGVKVQINDSDPAPEALGMF